MQYNRVPKRIGNTVRLAQLVQVLVKHGFADLVRRTGIQEGLGAKVLVRMRIMDQPSGEPHTLGRRLRAVLTELGPTFIKFGQVLSTRPELIGHQLCKDLGLLQDQVKPVGFDVIAPVFEQTFGQAVDALYAEFNKEPVASASLSQVYKARLRTGEPVAVKVLRPGVRAIIDSDLSLMHALAEWIEEHVADLAWMNFPGAVDEFARSVRRELDFTVEARVIDRFRENFKNDVRVLIPRVYREMSNDRVLTMEWVDGARVDDLQAYAARDSDPRTVAEIGCSVLCEMVFAHQFFHADPHPGNILITRHNRIAFLDYGMVGHLDRSDVLAMADLLRAVVHEDAGGAARALLAFTEQGDVEDESLLTHEIAEYIAFEAQSILSGGQVGEAIDKLTALLRRNQLQLAPRFSLLLKAMATVESTGHLLDDTLDMTPLMRPHAERILLSRFAPKEIYAEATHHAGMVWRLLRDMPGDLQSLMRAMRRGRLKIQITHEGLRDFAATTDRASNRLSFAIIIAALIISSSWLLAADAVHQSISLGGFVVTGVLGLALAVSILRSRNY